MSIAARAKATLPQPLWQWLRRGRRVAIRLLQRGLRSAGLLTAKVSDYYSPLPDPVELRRTEALWNKPSALAGVQYDLDAMERRLTGLAGRWFGERTSLPSHEEARAAGFGPGYPRVDALVLYAVLRELKPRRYLEVGSGLSTFYATLAAAANADDGRPLTIECIEPFPYPRLRAVPGLRIRQQPVQEVALSEFARLEAGDVLFIDSSHALKIGSDVAYLMLEVLPTLAPGVWIHIHDMPFPYNIPYPPEFWIFDQHWPIYWNEAMVVQALLSGSRQFTIELSLPLLRHFREESLARLIPDYPRGDLQADTFSSLWLCRQPAASADLAAAKKSEKPVAAR